MTVSRVKRARTEAVSPAPLSPVDLRSSGASPTKGRLHDGASSSAIPEDGYGMIDEDNDIQWQPGIEQDEPMVVEEMEEPDYKAQVCIHIRTTSF